MERGWGVNILEDARHCSVLYIRKYFVLAVNMKILLAIVEAALRCDVNCPARAQGGLWCTHHNRLHYKSLKKLLSASPKLEFLKIISIAITV